MIRRSELNEYEIIVIGGGHAGAEAAWAACNLGARTALVTMDPAKIGAMSCNPAIGGLAKGQMVREIDALGGLMGLAADATGIQFRMLNLSKGPAVHGPRCQSDKYRYAAEVQRLLRTRAQLDIITGTVEGFVIERDRCVGVSIRSSKADGAIELRGGAVVLTTGTFMRGLMHTGEAQTPGGRVGEGAAVGISAALADLGFELGRLKTGTPPRLAAESLHLHQLPEQPGDAQPQPFSYMTDRARFPVIEQRSCWTTHTSAASHELIRANLHRAPMYNGQIATAGPRYCPSIEDKVVRFADRDSHHVYLEPESHSTNEIYCNGISTSLPRDVQDQIVRQMPGCADATILRYGYAVEYDMVRPHQIDATCMTKRIEGLFLAGQINGTSGYEEAAGQGLVAGLNAVRYARGRSLMRFGREQAYIGVLLDDLVTKTPREPYRMFTSRAEFRLLLRADNADMRLTPLGRELGLVDDARWSRFERRREAMASTARTMQERRVDGQSLRQWAKRPETTVPDLRAWLGGNADDDVLATVLADLQYEGFIARQQREVQKLAAQEATVLPAHVSYASIHGLRREAAQTLERFRPATLGQAARLEGVTPADLMVVTVAMGR